MTTLDGLDRFYAAAGLGMPQVRRSLAAVLFDKVFLFAVFFLCNVWYYKVSSPYRLPRFWLSAMEALVAISLAGNVLQFLEYATKIATQAKRYHHSINGRLQKHIEIEQSVDNLERLLTKLRYVPVSSGNDAKIGDCDIDPSLRSKAEECIAVGDEMRRALYQIQMHGRQTWSSSLRKAFRSVMSESYIAQLQHRLSSVQQDLQLHLNVDQREKLKEIQAGQSELLSKLDAVASSIYLNVLEGQENLLNVHGKMLSQELRDMRLQNTRMVESFDSFKATFTETTTQVVPTPDLETPPLPTPTGKDLYKAIRDERFDIVPEIIQRGANVSFVSDKDDSRPIHLVAKQGNIAIMDLLLQNGAEVDCYNGQGLTPLMLAARHGVLRSVQRLLRAGSDINAKVVACRPGIVAGIDLDNVTTSDSTALTLAAQNGHVAVLRELLARGASVDAASNHRFTALHAAVQNGRPACVEVLLESGASIEAVTDQGFTPLIYAANVNNEECARILLEHGANTEAKKSYGTTAMLEAIWTRNTAIVEVLVKGGANTEVTTGILGDRHTPLQMAAENSDLKTVEVLLRHGADQEHRLSNGMTAEENARRRCDSDLVEVFEQHRLRATK